MTDTCCAANAYRYGSAILYVSPSALIIEETIFRRLLYSPSERR